MSDFQHATSSAYSYHKCRCDLCRSWKQAKDQAYYQANKDRIKTQAKAYYRTNQSAQALTQKLYRENNAETIKAQKAQYAKDNSARLTAKAMKWVKDNPERYKEATARFRENHREEIRVADSARYAKMMATDPERIRKQRREYAKTPYGRAMYYSFQNKRRRSTPYTKEAREWIASINWATETCTYCPATAVEIDHILPIAKGGDGSRDNLTPACRSCNSRKGNRYLADFLGFVEPERMKCYA